MTIFDFFNPDDAATASPAASTPFGPIPTTTKETLDAAGIHLVDASIEWDECEDGHIHVHSELEWGFADPQTAMLYISTMKQSLEALGGDMGVAGRGDPSLN